MIVPCDICGCLGNGECNYPPDLLEDCALNSQGICPCCRSGTNRMDYRPEEDGQESFFGEGLA